MVGIYTIAYHELSAVRSFCITLLNLGGISERNSETAAYHSFFDLANCQRWYHHIAYVRPKSNAW